MRTPLALVCLLALAVSQAQAAQAPADQAPAGRQVVALSLHEAIETALRTDPLVLQSLIAEQRGRLGVLRAQLDRFTLQVNASLQEQWQAGNIGGPVSPGTCLGLLATTPAGCGMFNSFLGSVGIPNAAYYVPPQGIYSAGVGLLNLSANLQLPIFSGFRVSSNVARAKHNELAAQASVRASIRSLAVDVLRAYWTVRRAEMQREVSRQSLERFNDAVTVVAARVRAGLVPQVDLNRTETRRQAEVARLADLDGAAAEGRAQLAVLLGLGGAELQLTEEVDVPTPPPDDTAAVDGMLSTARRGRPELRVARMQTLLGLDQLRIVKSAYYPQLTGVALLQFGNNPFNPLTVARSEGNADPNPFNNTSMSTFFGATLSLNIFDTLNTYTAARDQRYEISRLEQEERRLGRLVESDVRTAHARLLHGYRTREPLVRTRDLARDTLDIIERRYKNGDALILDYLDAQFDLFNAELNLVNTNANIAQTWGELQAATGRIPGTAKEGDQLP